MKLKKGLSTLCLITTLFLCRAQSPEPTLKIGDPAPPIVVSKWLKGGPPTPGNVIVVEFWATWCAPCKAAMPHLSDLADLYKGDVDVVSVNVREQEHPIAGHIDTMVAEMVRKMDNVMRFNVARDSEDSHMTKKWLNAASERGGIPFTVIVNWQGQIAWVGHPKDMDDVLASIVAGKYDIITGDKISPERRLEIIERYNLSVEANNKKDYKTALEIYDAAYAIYPEIVMVNPVYKLNLLLRLDQQQALEYCEKMRSFASMYAFEIARSITNEPGRLPGLYEFAVKCLKVYEGVPRSELELSALGTAYFYLGQQDKALAVLREGVEMSKTAGGTNYSVGVLKKTLADFEAKVDKP